MKAPALATGKLKIEYWPVDKCQPYPKNPRQITEKAIKKVAQSIEQFGFQQPLVLDEHGVVIVGHTRLAAARSLGMKAVPVVVAHGMPEAHVRAYRIADNRSNSETSWAEDTLFEELEALQAINFDLMLTAFDADEINKMLGDGSGGGGGGEAPAVTLRERFGVPPFSVLDARQGYWQDRKAAWLALGIRSEIGRGTNLLKFSDTIKQPDPEKRAAKKLSPGGGSLGNGKGSAYAAMNGEADSNEFDGTSIFDPVLAELAVRWFCPVGGLVLDPFAGGSVRGIVAGRLGRNYVGIDLRKEQVQANRVQAKEIKPSCKPVWIEGDSANLNAIAKREKIGKCDLVFTCPPYGDLEVYSENPADISTMPHADFLKVYRSIIALACGYLRQDRFAMIVVGDFRDKEGMYRNFVSETIRAFEGAGLHLYNEAILVQPIGSLAIRAGKQFANSRKLGKNHQNVLVFVKGDPLKATAAIGEVEFADPLEIAVVEEMMAQPDQLLQGLGGTLSRRCETQISTSSHGAD